MAVYLGNISTSTCNLSLSIFHLSFSSFNFSNNSYPLAASFWAFNNPAFNTYYSFFFCTKSAFSSETLFSQYSFCYRHSLRRILDLDNSLSILFKFYSRGLIFSYVRLYSITAFTQSASGTAYCDAFHTFSLTKE